MAGQMEHTIVENQVYDVIMALGQKLEGLAAYNKYEQDGNAQLWQQLRRQDEDCVHRLLEQLEQFGQQGKLKARSMAGTAR